MQSALRFVLGAAAMAAACCASAQLINYSESLGAYKDLRDGGVKLIDGVTPIQDVQRALGIDELPHAEEYETLAGFLMVMLRRVPKRTDCVRWGGFSFEVMDVDAHRIDQVMVTRGGPASATP